ncbi:heparinase II/III family protein [Accumulibacter sp.]|uniref:Heparinase II/III family protein n=1 Tax=Accumulibacter regalis TaxID=522306 RepID=C7RVN9_ACCRE|nr:heparinase II/III family protein [Accumulibacter sp.]MBN8496660.1 alginate lyase family protein [Accumulibacter sp.]MBO3716466.1 alginate lyase family protein [Accumulibacter sp.]
MGIGRILLLLRTIRHLRTEQVLYRLYYRLAKPLVARLALAPIRVAVRRSWSEPWSAPLTSPRSHLTAGVFEFLGERGEVKEPSDWNSDKHAKLWLYNLHYLDDLNAVDADTRAEQQGWLIERWIHDNPSLTGNGWEPYTLSLRLVNLVKWCARQEQVPAEWLDSIARQAQALAAQEERHILANHLFANGKALTFAGTFLGGDSGSRCLHRGLGILDREIPEQFLADGGHFELSPMYHATLLWDLCDLLNLAQRSGLPELSERAPAWHGAIERGMAWLGHMCHPDGEIAFFNDATFGIAPRSAQITAYARALGCPGDEAVVRPLLLNHLVDTGYIVVELGSGGKALLDVANVGPDYQPGHAHADTLSFELSLFGERVLVNSGTSRYGEGAERQRQRSTSAHNTVEVDGEDSSEVWAGFRVARRARPIALEFWRDVWQDGERVVVRCSHDGYRRLSGSPIHRRQWEFRTGGLRVIDAITGGFRQAVSRFHLHPDVRVTGDRELRLAGGQVVRWSVTDGHAQMVPSTWHPGFGVSVSNQCIEVLFEGAAVVVDFDWA